MNPLRDSDGSTRVPHKDAPVTESDLLLVKAAFGPKNDARLHPDIEVDQLQRARRLAVDLARDGGDPETVRIKVMTAYSELTAAGLSEALNGYRGQAQEEGRQDGDIPTVAVGGIEGWLDGHPEGRRERSISAAVCEIRKALPGAADREVRRLAVQYVDRAEELAEAAPLFVSGSDLIAGTAGSEQTPAVAVGAAYEGRAVLVHAQRGTGKTTLMAWLAANATIAGRRVLVVGDDDPASWAIRMRRFGADNDAWSYGTAAALSRPGKLEEAADGFDWIIVDNWRTWAIESGIEASGGFGSTGAAAVPIQRLVAVVRDTGRALTVLANEGWHDQTRSRDSSVVEDAVDATRKVRVDQESRVTTLAPAGKTRVGIPETALRWRLREDGTGMDEQGHDRGGPVTVDEVGAVVRLDPVREFCREWREANPQGRWRAFRADFRAGSLTAGDARLHSIWDGLGGERFTLPDTTPGTARTAPVSSSTKGESGSGGSDLSESGREPLSRTAGSESGSRAVHDAPGHTAARTTSAAAAEGQNVLRFPGNGDRAPAREETMAESRRRIELEHAPDDELERIARLKLRAHGDQWAHIWRRERRLPADADQAVKMLAGLLAGGEAWHWDGDYTDTGAPPAFTDSDWKAALQGRRIGA